MKKMMMTLALVTLASTAASAGTFCNVMGESAEGQFDQPLATLEVTLKQEPTLIYKLNDRVQAYASRNEDGWTSVMLGNVAAKKFEAMAFGNGKATVLVSQTRKVAIACIDFE